MTVNQIPNPSTKPRTVVDFSWYPMNGAEPNLSTTGFYATSDEFDFQITQPLTTTIVSSSFTPSSTPQDLHVINASMGNFLLGYDLGSTDGFGYLYLYHSETINAIVQYDSLYSPFGGLYDVVEDCVLVSGSGGTFVNGDFACDPRYIRPLAEIDTGSVIYMQFDAVDSFNMGLPKTLDPSTITSWLWDLGNGQTASGPTASTYYFAQPSPSQLKVTLTATDYYNNIYYVTHPVQFAPTFTSSAFINENQIVAHGSDLG